MEKPPEGLVTKLFVTLGMQNQLMPQVIHHLRRHGNELAPTLEISKEELAQRVRNQLTVLKIQFRPLLAQSFKQADGERVASDVLGLNRCLRLRQKHGHPTHH